jgi:propanediol dehydratase large subunit
MRETMVSTEVSVCVSPQGDAAVFVTGDDRPRVADVARLASAFAARGLRLLGVSRSAHRAPAVCAAGTRSAVVTSESVLDAVLSLVDAREPALA